MISSFVYKSFDLSRLTRKLVSKPGSLDYRVFLSDSLSNEPVSPWHNIPLANWENNVILPFVCEIPRKQTAKMEVNLKEKTNPIAQDVKDGKLRFMPIEPKFNYGMIPMTYEDPDRMCPVSNSPGDGDPIDVVDISVRNSERVQTGTVVPVKLLGSFCFIDNGEADWKLVVTRDESEGMNPHVIKEIFGFFENYKRDSGSYIYGNGKVFDVAETLEIIRHTQSSYEDLVNRHGSTQSRGEQLWFPDPK